MAILFVNNEKRYVNNCNFIPLVHVIEPTSTHYHAKTSPIPRASRMVFFLDPHLELQCYDCDHESLFTETASAVMARFSHGDQLAPGLHCNRVPWKYSSSGD